jgi:hypothetical protein
MYYQRYTYNYSFKVCGEIETNKELEMRDRYRERRWRIRVRPRVRDGGVAGRSVNDGG